MSDSLQPHGLEPARLLCPWGSPGKNTGVGCHALLQGIFLTQRSNPRPLCPLHCRRILYCWATREALIRDYLIANHNAKMPLPTVLVPTTSPEDCYLLNKPLFCLGNIPMLHPNIWQFIWPSFLDPKSVSNKIPILGKSGSQRWETTLQWHDLLVSFPPYLVTFSVPEMSCYQCSLLWN